MTTGTDIIIKDTGEVATVRKVRKNGDLVARRWSGVVAIYRLDEVEVLTFTAPK